GCRRDVDRQRTLAELLGEFEIDVPLPVANEFDGHPAFPPLVVEVQRARKGSGDAEHAALEQLVEVPRPRLVDDRELAGFSRLGGRRRLLLSSREGGEDRTGQCDPEEMTVETGPDLHRCPPSLPRANPFTFRRCRAPGSLRGARGTAS